MSSNVMQLRQVGVEPTQPDTKPDFEQKMLVMLRRSQRIALAEAALFGVRANVSIQ
jgi:hypothetical protein